MLTDFVSYIYLILSLFREGVGAPLLKSVQRYNKFFIPANFSPYFAAFIPHLVLKIPCFTQNYKQTQSLLEIYYRAYFFTLFKNLRNNSLRCSLLCILHNGSTMAPQWFSVGFLNGSSMSPHRFSSYYHPTTTLLPPYYHCTCIARPSTTLHPTIVRLSHVHLACI